MPVNINLLSDDVIAKGVLPPDYSKGFENFFAGRDQAQKQAEQSLFSGGLPRTPAGDIDWNQVGEQLARIQGAGAIPALAGLRTADIQQQALRDLPGATPLYSPNTTQSQRPQLPPSTQRSTLQTAPASEDSGGTPAPPGQNLTQPNEVPGSFKVTTDEPGTTTTLTARTIAQRTNQDPDTVASKLGVGLDQPLTPAEVRGRLQDIRPDSFAERSTGGPAPETAGMTPTRVATIPIRPQAEVPQITIPAQAQAQAGPPPPPPTREPIAQGQPGFFSEQNAQAYEDRARRVGYIAGRLALGGMAPAGTQYGQQAQRDFDVAKEIRGVLGEAAKPTPEMKEAAATGQSLPDYKRQTEDTKRDVEQFRKNYTQIQDAGINADANLSKVQVAKNLTLQPNFTSGPWNEQAALYQQFKSLFGKDVQAATPIEAFNKFSQDLLQERIKSMASSGVGRVLQSEVNIMRQSVASSGITASSNRALLEMIARTYQKEAELANITRNLPPNSAQLNATVANYLRNNPTFKPEEIRNPLLLGAPDAPPESARWSPAQRRAWASGVGLSPGDYIRFNGQIGTVP